MDAPYRYIEMGRRFRCGSCGASISLQPPHAQALSTGASVPCHICKSAISGDELFAQLVSADSFAYLHFVADYVESSTEFVQVGHLATVSLSDRVERTVTVETSVTDARVTAKAVPSDQRSFTILVAVDKDATLPKEQIEVRWRAYCVASHLAMPAWLDFLDSAYSAAIDGNHRGVILDGHAALDAFLSEHQVSRLKARGIEENACQWIVDRAVSLDVKLGRLLLATDGFELGKRDTKLKGELLKSQTLRNALIHKKVAPVTMNQAITTLRTILAVIRLIDPLSFWWSMVGYGGLPRTTEETVETETRSIRITFGVEKAGVPRVTLTGACAQHLDVLDVSKTGLTLRHKDPLDHSWEYGLTAEYNP